MHDKYDFKKFFPVIKLYNVFHQFKQAKIAYGGSILSSSQFLLLPQLPLNMTLDIKVVKIGEKIIISLL